MESDIGEDAGGCTRTSQKLDQLLHVPLLISNADYPMCYSCRDRPGLLAPTSDTQSVETTHGRIYSKLRWFIIVAIFTENYIALPLFTHGGKGLDAKPIEALDEYISVYDPRNPGPELQLSAHQPLRTCDMSGTILRVNTCAHISNPVSRNYTLRVETKGRLNKSSTERIIALFGRTMKNGML